MAARRAAAPRPRRSPSPRRPPLGLWRAGPLPCRRPPPGSRSPGRLPRGRRPRRRGRRPAPPPLRQISRARTRVPARRRRRPEDEHERKEPLDEGGAALARELRLIGSCRLAGARDEVDHRLASVLDRRLEQRHDRCRGGGEADGEHDPVDEAVAALLAANALGFEGGRKARRAWWSPPSWLDGLGEKAKEAVSEQKHEHGKQWGDWRVHGEVGAVGGALEVAVLLGTRLCRLLAEEVEVGLSLAARSSAKRANVGSPASRATRTSASRSPSERFLRASERARVSSSPSGPGQSRAASSSASRSDWPAPRASASTEIASGRSKDRLSPPLDLGSEHEVGSEEAGESEEEQDPADGSVQSRPRREGAARAARRPRRAPSLRGTVRASCGRPRGAGRARTRYEGGRARPGEFRSSARRVRSRERPLPGQADREPRSPGGVGVGEKSPPTTRHELESSSTRSPWSLSCAARVRDRGGP